MPTITKILPISFAGSFAGPWVRSSATLICVIISLLMQPDSWAAESTNNRLLERLLARGVQLGDEKWEPLPAPTFGDELEPGEERSLLERTAGRYGWDRFVRDSTVAPFQLKLAYLKDTLGNRVGHKIDLWFVVHGELAQLRDNRLAERLFQTQPNENDKDPGKPNAVELTADDLSQISIALPENDEERFVFVEFPLMNRVFVRGVGHAIHSKSPTSILVAWEIDNRFMEAGKWANRWHAIKTDNLGNRRLGAAHSYQGYAGYAKITRLAKPEGALLIETHVIFHEPQDWFHGSNFLRSKIPLMVQENVRRLRRQLSRVEK